MPLHAAARKRPSRPWHGWCFSVVKIELECRMEQLSAELVENEPQARGENRMAVPNWDVGASLPAGGASQSDERGGVAKLDLPRKAMVAAAAVLTLLWFAFLAWGAVRLVGTLFF